MSDCDQLQTNPTGLQEWSAKWQLNFEQQKCKVLRNGNPSPLYYYTMVDQYGSIHPLGEVEAEKDLGV